MMTTQPIQGLRTTVTPDKDNRTVTVEFYVDDKNNAKFVFTKADTHWLIDTLQQACNAIGNRVKKGT